MKFRIVLLLAFAALALSGCISLADDITPPPGYKTPTPRPTMGPLYPANPPSAQRGAEIYAEKCAPCHGDTGLGNGPDSANLPNPVPALAAYEIAKNASPAAWFTIVTQGNIEKFMPPFNSLTEQQRWDVVAFAQGLNADEEKLSRGREVYEASCAQCHGANGSQPTNGSLTDLQTMAGYSLTDLINFTSNGTGEMPGFSPQLTADDISAVAAYTRSLWLATAQPTAAPQPTATPEPVTETPEATSAEGEAATPEAGITPDGTGQTEAEPAPESTETEAALAGTGSFSGQVVHGSGEKLPAGVKVVLHGFDHDFTTSQFTEIVTIETEADADGFFLFENIEIPEGRAFYASVTFDGFEYSSEAVFVQADQVIFDLPVTVFATTTDPSVLLAQQLHILFDYSKPGVVQVIQFYVIANPSTTTVIPAEEGLPALTFNLPQGATNLQFENGALGGRFVLTGDGFGDLQPLAPTSEGNGYQLIYAYELPLQDSQEIRQTINMKASTVSILAPLGVTITGENLVDGGQQDMGTGGSFQIYTVSDLQAGSELAFTIAGTPSQPATSPTTSGTDDTTRNIIIAIGAFGIGLILAGAYLFWRDRQLGTDDDDDEDDNADEDEDPAGEEDILDAIIALDDQFRVGNIPEEAYRQRRAELKARLKKFSK